MCSLQSCDFSKDPFKLYTQTIYVKHETTHTYRVIHCGIILGQK